MNIINDFLLPLKRHLKLDCDSLRLTCLPHTVQTDNIIWKSRFRSAREAEDLVRKVTSERDLDNAQ